MSYTVPAFSGQSYLRLRKMRSVNKELRIELRFKSLNDDGLLLLAADDLSQPGDFVSLALVDGFVEFRCDVTLQAKRLQSVQCISCTCTCRYNLGSGPLTIRSTERVRLNEFHTLTAKRRAKDGVLQLDDGAEVAGMASGTLTSLDVDSDVFLGFVPTMNAA